MMKVRGSGNLIKSTTEVVLIIPVYHVLSWFVTPASENFTGFEVFMKKKNEISSANGSFVKRMRGGQTLKAFALKKGVKLKTLSKHEEGFLSLHTLLTYADSDEKLFKHIISLKKFI
jgi:hypothetical protein